jgi:hypothetical protein
VSGAEDGDNQSVFTRSALVPETYVVVITLWAVTVEGENGSNCVHPFSASSVVHFKHFTPTLTVVEVDNPDAVGK